MTKIRGLQCSKICPHCKTVFTRATRRFFSAAIYCSRECYADWKYKRSLVFDVENFWAGFERVPWSGCWIWTRATFHADYGCIQWIRPDGQRKLTGIHRVAYTLTKGPIPQGMEVMHSCDVRCCGNPDHLSLGTRLDNMRDAARKGRNVAAQLKPDQVREVRALLGTKMNTEIAELFGVSVGVVSAIKRGRTYQHVE